jgi:RNA polymerase sigma-70 factor (ECF subfamily)
MRQRIAQKILGKQHPNFGSMVFAGICKIPQQDLNQRLSQISPKWSMLFQAHVGTMDAVQAAQTKFVERYRGAVYRYLLGAVRDPDLASDLAQEFAYRFVRGDFRRASPERGRFRDYLKIALIHLVTDYRRRQQGRPQPLVLEPVAPATAPDEMIDSKRVFLQSWKEDLWARSWTALEQLEHKTGQPCHTVLRLKEEQPLLESAALAQRLGEKLGKAYTIHGVRQALHRAREKFADVLLNEIVHSLDNPTVEEVEAELIDLGWQPHCRAALERRLQR